VIHLPPALVAIAFVLLARRRPDAAGLALLAFAAATGVAFGVFALSGQDGWGARLLAVSLVAAAPALAGLLLLLGIRGQVRPAIG
jgi:hypothetical protein